MLICKTPRCRFALGDVKLMKNTVQKRRISWVFEIALFDLILEVNDADDALTLNAMLALFVNNCAYVGAIVATLRSLSNTQPVSRLR